MVHGRLGEAELARKAGYEAELLARAPAAEESGLVEWVGTERFASEAQRVDANPPANAPAPRQSAAPRNDARWSWWIR